MVGRLALTDLRVAQRQNECASAEVDRLTYIKMSRVVILLSGPSKASRSGLPSSSAQ